MLFLICRPDLRSQTGTYCSQLLLQPPFEALVNIKYRTLTTNAHRSQRPLKYLFARRLTGPTLQEGKLNQMRIIIIAQV